MKTQIKSHLAAAITSGNLQSVRRGVAELRRKLRGAEHEVHYFHDVADPYCYLTAQILPEFQERYRVKLCIHMISGPHSDAIPAPSEHRQNALMDAGRLARRIGLDAPQEPTAKKVETARRLLAAALGEPDAAERLRAITASVWGRETMPDDGGVDPGQAMEVGDQKLAAMGHYLGGTFYYGGEWYWGVDRLHYLEDRLAQLHLRQGDVPIAPLKENAQPPDIQDSMELEFFFSFRSPYSYLAFDRVVDLANRYNARLILRPVLPMLMRGLPVPKLKSGYILGDCAREARRMKIPFGRICDPLGSGVERGYALFDYAEDHDRLATYCSTFMRLVWSEGVDAASDKGMARIAGASGLDWGAARQALATQTWRDRVEKNQSRLQEIGLWGVPSFYVAGQAIWGQDRLWAVEDLLRAQGSSTGGR